MSITDLERKAFQQWLDKAAASDYLPERRGYSFTLAFGSSSSSSSQGEKETTRLGIPRLHELAVRCSAMLDQFRSSATLQRKKQTYVEKLFHPFQTSILHGKWFRHISLAEIAVAESVYWQKQQQASGPTPSPTPITLVLADKHFDLQTRRVFESLHSYLDLPGPPALPTVHEEVSCRFFPVPLSQFCVQLASAAANQLRGTIILSAADHASPSDFHATMDRLEYLCANYTHETGFPPRIILRLPSYGGPATSTWLFARDSLPRTLHRAGLQRSYRLTKSAPEEHERLVLARNGIPELFVHKFVIGSDSTDDFLRLWVRPCETDTEWMNEEVRAAFTRLTQASIAPGANELMEEDDDNDGKGSALPPQFRGMLTNAPWTELDEFRLTSAADRASTLSFMDAVDEWKHLLADDAKLFVFCPSEEMVLQLRQQWAMQRGEETKSVVDFVNLQDPDCCSRMHAEPEDWLQSISYLLVWFPVVAEEGGGTTGDVLERFLFFLSAMRSKELNGFTLQSNNANFVAALLAEKERRDQELQLRFYAPRRIRPFCSLCAEGTSDAELAGYL